MKKPGNPLRVIRRSACATDPNVQAQVEIRYVDKRLGWVCGVDIARPRVGVRRYGRTKLGALSASLRDLAELVDDVRFAKERL